jgi:hypothetical protein
MIFACGIYPADITYFFQYLLFPLGAIAFLCLFLKGGDLGFSRSYRLACLLPSLLGIYMQYQANFSGWLTPCALALLGLVLAIRMRRDKIFLQRLSIFYPLFICAPACVAFSVNGIHLFHLISCAAFAYGWHRHRQAPDFSLALLRSYCRFLFFASFPGMLAIELWDLSQLILPSDYEQAFKLHALTYTLQMLGLVILLFLPLFWVLFPPTTRATTRD